MESTKTLKVQAITPPQVESCAPGPTISVTVEYFAMFRSLARKNSEILETETTDPAALYDRLRGLYRLKLDRSSVHLVVNDEFAPWDLPLRQGDRVAYLPPMSGG